MLTDTHLAKKKAVENQRELFLQESDTKTFDDTFLTDLEQSAYLSKDGGREQNTEKRSLVPFVSPPPPHIATRKYKMFVQRDDYSRRMLGEWEKTVLFRLKPHPKFEENQSQERLSHVHERNNFKHIQEVQERSSELAKAKLNEHFKDFCHNEQRRNDIFFRYKNLPMLRTLDKFVARSQIWYTIVVSHVFITALIHEQKVQEAMKTFSYLLSPMANRFVVLQRKRRERQEMTARMLSKIPYPSPQIIESMPGTFFKGWPATLLQSLAEKAKPTYMKQGTYLLHAGDVGRSMFMITLGQVRIIFKKKNNIKKRSLENASGSLLLDSPCYVGEFALVCKEPRSASIFCETDVGFWTVSPADFEEVAKLLSTEVASKQREATDGRRRQNLKNLFPLKVEFLRKFSFFEKFTTEGLTKIVENVEPIVLHDGDRLISVGEIDTSTYFIQDGIALLIDEEGNESQIKTGNCIGIFECACGVNEWQKTSIVSINYCDIWKMSRELLMDVGLSEPTALLHCRKAAKSMRAVEIKKEAKIPYVIRSDPFLSFCFLSSHLARLYELCTPCVYLRGERIVIMGQAVTSLIVLFGGSVDVTVANNGELATCRFTISSNGKDRKIADKNVFSRGQTPILGSYEYAASLNKYTCTATSCGLTEAFVVDICELNTVIPLDLQKIIKENLRGRELVNKAYMEFDFSCINVNNVMSFAKLYKEQRDKELKKKKKR